jgi:type 1 glutamine amidotransferase
MKMRSTAVSLASLFSAVLICSSALAESKRLLVVSTTKGFRHSSIETAEKVIEEIGKKTGVFEVDFARVNPRDPKFHGADGKPDGSKIDAAITAVLADKLGPANLENLDGVIFANTTGMLPIPDREAFMQWMKSGGAFIGMHSATDTLKGWPEYVEMIGGHFAGHGRQVTVDVENMDPKHPATRHFRKYFQIHDEIYVLAKFYREKVHGLLTLDKNPHSGSKQFNHPGDFPIAWSKNIGKGKLFHTSLGHREDVWESAEYQQHILGGIKWALGLEEGEGEPQDLAYTVPAKEKERGFVPLFNGKDLSGWKLRKADGTPSWSAQNGMLVNSIEGGGHGTDLITTKKFRDFVLKYEYMVPEGSNSGLYLRGRHEIQILGDFAALKAGSGGNGGLYSVKPPDHFVSLPSGRWQRAMVSLRGDRLTVTMNGVKIHDRVEVNKATGGELDRELDQPGPIMVQGDHGAVAFRNMRIKEVK